MSDHVEPLTVAELIDQLRELPGDVPVYIEDECCACSNGAEEVMLVEDRELAFGNTLPPFVVITG